MIPVEPVDLHAIGCEYAQDLYFWKPRPNAKCSRSGTDMYHLILIHQPGKQAYSDFESIAARISEQVSDIRVFIVDTRERDWELQKIAAAAPTLTVSPMPIKKFAPARGRILQGFDFPKSTQYKRLTAQDVPVPGWLSIEPGLSLDPNVWGAYVVIKPDISRKGAEIKIKRTGRVRYKPPEAFDDDHPARHAPLLVQRFIYTGRWPNNYRVVTLFGRALMSWHCEAVHSHRPLEARYAFRGGSEGGGITIVSNKMGSSYRLSAESEVIALAEQAHSAFPDQPLLGTDIVRNVETGDLYVLESNPRGDAWLMSSDTGNSIQTDKRIDFGRQFDALDIAAEVLIERTRALAE